MPLDGMNDEHELPVTEARNRMSELVDAVRAGEFIPNTSGDHSVVVLVVDVGYRREIYER